MHLQTCIASEAVSIASVSPMNCSQIYRKKTQRESQPGFANFIDEWSHYDFCFTKFWSHFGIFGVKYHKEKSHFSDFPACGPRMYCIHYREEYTK